MKKKIIRLTESDIRRMVSNTVRRLVEGGEEDPYGYHDPDEGYDDNRLVECEEESTVSVVVFLDSGEVMDGYYYDDRELPPNAILLAVRPLLRPNVEDDGEVYSMDMEGFRDVTPEYPEYRERLWQNYSRVMQILNNNFDKIAEMVAERSYYVRY